MPNNPANPRPKRSADLWTRTHHQEASGPSKKARFDLRNPSALAPDAPDEEEDAFLEADELTKRGNHTKRSAVNIDGFESDSSNEGFDARAAAKAKEKKEAEKAAAASKAEEDNDMFADLEEDLAPDGDADEDLGREGKKTKAVKFADLDQVEDLDEVEESKSGGHVHANLRNEKAREDEESSSAESEVGDEVRAGLEDDMDAELGAGSKKKYAPKLDAFNLQAEKEEGNFDESLNFVRKAADPDAIHDSWMAGMSKKDIRKAKEAQAKREREQRQKTRDDDALDTGDILGCLITLLQHGETSLEALARLAPKKEKKRPKWQVKKQKAKSGEMEVDEAPAALHNAEEKRRKAVDGITGATDVLMERGIIDIKDTREMLMRHYRRETGQDWIDKEESGAVENGADAELWEFRWSNAEDEIQGPEPREKMKAWSDAGYFAGGVEFRPAGSNEVWRTNVAF
jgi:CD2 antigen cytoplasmic tail-binding protein 2